MENTSRISIPTSLGNLIAEVGAVPDYPEIYIYIQRPDEREVDLAIIGVRESWELDGAKPDVRAFLRCGGSVDYTTSYVWENEDITKEES